MTLCWSLKQHELQLSLFFAFDVYFVTLLSILYTGVLLEFTALFYWGEYTMVYYRSEFLRTVVPVAQE